LLQRETTVRVDAVSAAGGEVPESDRGWIGRAYDAAKQLLQCELAGRKAQAQAIPFHPQTVRLHEVRVQGFRCFGKEPVTLDLRAPGILAISGKSNSLPGPGAPL
jgi:hypothetical protein